MTEEELTEAYLHAVRVSLEEGYDQAEAYRIAGVVLARSNNRRLNNAAPVAGLLFVVELVRLAWWLAGLVAW